MNRVDDFDEVAGAEDDRLGAKLAGSFERLARNGKVDETVRQRAADRMQRAHQEAIDGAPASSLDEAPATAPAELLLLLSATDDRTPRRWWLAGAAATVVGLCVGALLLAVTDRVEQPANAPSATAAETPPGVERISPLDVPRTLEPGRYATDALGGEASFELGEEVQLVRLQPGLIEFVLGDASASTVSIVRPVGLTDEIMATSEATTLREVLEQLPGAQRTPSSVGDLRAQRWRWANPVAEGPCAGDACSDVFVSPRNVGIEMGRTTDVFLIDMPGGDDLVVLVSLAAVDFALSPTGAVGDLLDSLQLAGVSLDAATTPDVPVIVELPVRPAAPGDG